MVTKNNLKPDHIASKISRNVIDVLFSYIPTFRNPLLKILDLPLRMHYDARIELIPASTGILRTSVGIRTRPDPFFSPTK